MGLFSFLNSSSSSSSSSSTSSTSQDQKAAADNGATSQSGSNNTLTNQFSDNTLKAFEALGTIAAGSLQLVSDTTTQLAKNSQSSLAAVTSSPSQVGADNSTLQKMLPYIVLLGGIFAVTSMKGK